MLRSRLLISTIAVGLAIVTPQAALACIPSLLTPEERRAQTLAYQVSSWNNASSVYLAQVAAITMTVKPGTESLYTSRMPVVFSSFRTMLEVQLTLTPMLSLKGPTSSEPISLSFSKAMIEEPVCNAPLWRDHEDHPTLGKRYLVYSGFSTSQIGSDARTVFELDVQDPTTLAAWDAAALQPVQQISD